MTEQVWWYATRAAGLMTWSTAVASVIIGMLLSTRLLGRRASASWLLDVHRFLGGLSAVFLIVHMVTLWADSFVDFGWEELLIPGRSSFDNVAVAWGVGAMWSLIAVEITSILRRWISHSLWKRTHYLSIVTVGAGSVHGYQLGSDVDNPLAWGGALAASGVVIILSLFRLRKKPSQRLVTERASVLLEMRERLAELPVPESMPQPTLETSEIEGEAILPRRAPVRKGPELPPPPMPDLEIDDRLTELALDDFDSAEQINTLLDQFRNLPTPGEIENDPAVPPSAPSGLDRPPEFSRSSDEQPLPPPAPVEDAEPLSSHPFDDLVAMGDTRTAPQPPPPPGLETPDSEDDDRPAQVFEPTPFEELVSGAEPASPAAQPSAFADLVADAEQTAFEQQQRVEEAVPYEEPPAYEEPVLQPDVAPVPPPEPAPPHAPAPPPAPPLLPPDEPEAAPPFVEAVAYEPPAEQLQPMPEPPEPEQPQPALEQLQPMPEPPEPEQPQPALEQLQPMPEPPEPEPEIADPWVAALSEALGVVEDDLDAPSFVAEPPPVTPDPDKTDPLPKREPQWVDSEVNHEPPPLRQPSAPEPKYEPPQAPNSEPESELRPPAPDPQPLLPPTAPAPQSFLPPDRPEQDPVPAPPGPPPLPEVAVDPITGETDQNAYKAWLVEWLAYAERYGDEAPSDPDRG